MEVIYKANRISYILIIKIIIILLYIILLFIFIILDLIRINNIKKFYKGTAICIIIKEEMNYIKEFIRHYKELGFDKIYIYDNNDVNQENYNDLLKEYINSHFVEILNARGKSKYQLLAYNDCYKKHLKDYSWFLFIDADEFLYIKKNKTLIEFLNAAKFFDCDNILINYKEFGDSDLIYYDQRPLSLRFTKNYKYCTSMKAFVKGGLENAKMNIHRSYNVRHYCDSEGRKIEPGEYSTPYIQVKSAEIWHYITKTIEEFYKRLKKGWPHVIYGSKQYHSFIERRIKKFFNLNKITIQKINILYPLIKNQSLLKDLMKKLN